jgi:hypothetical protein
MCGVRITLSKPRSGETNGSSVALGLDREDVDRRAGEVPDSQRRGERVEVDDRAARGVDQQAPCFMRASSGADHVPGGRRLGHVQRDDVGAASSASSEPSWRALPSGSFGLDVVVEHHRMPRLGEHADLRADVAVADDAEHLAARLVAARRALGPAAAVQQRVLLRDAAHQHHDLGEHQLGDAARVGEGRVEHRDAAARRGGQVDLVGADAEAADRDQPGRRLEHRRSVELGARADAEDVVERRSAGWSITMPEPGTDRGWHGDTLQARSRTRTPACRPPVTSSTSSPACCRPGGCCPPRPILSTTAATGPGRWPRHPPRWRFRTVSNRSRRWWAGRVEPASGWCPPAAAPACPAAPWPPMARWWWRWTG